MIRIPVCFSCKYFIADYSKKGVYKCSGFPEGIPNDVFNNKTREDKRECTSGYHYVERRYKRQQTEESNNIESRKDT